MILLTNGFLMTMQDENIENGFLLINGSKIEKFGKMENLPQNLKTNKTINLMGKTVLPGFIDAHTHLGMSEDGVGDEGEDINEMSDPATPQIRAIDAVDPLDKCILEALSAGITTAVITPGSSNPIAGQIAAFKTYGNDISKMILSEPLAMKFSMGENPKKIYGTQDLTPMSRMATAAIIRENLFKTKRYIEDKERAIEEDSSLPEFDFKLESLIPVITRKIKAHFHAHRAYDIQTAIRIAKEFNLDYVIIHGTESYRISDILANEKCSVICGPIIGTRSKPELSRQSYDNCSLLLKAGVNIAISSDHPEVPSQFLLLSTSVLLNHGMSEHDVLLSLTYNSAKAIGLENQIGSLKEGLDADIIIFNGNPLDVKNNPEMIFINGQQIK